MKRKVCRLDFFSKVQYSIIAWGKVRTCVTEGQMYKKMMSVKSTTTPVRVEDDVCAGYSCANIVTYKKRDATFRIPVMFTLTQRCGLLQWTEHRNIRMNDTLFRNQNALSRGQLSFHIKGKSSVVNKGAPRIPFFPKQAPRPLNFTTHALMASCPFVLAWLLAFPHQVRSSVRYGANGSHKWAQRSQPTLNTYNKKNKKKTIEPKTQYH